MLKKVFEFIRNILAVVCIFALTAGAVILGLEKGKKNNAKPKIKKLDDDQADIAGDYLANKYLKR
ncbi:MAG: hypothetical protein LBD99_06575 [Candidatus Margulisbacteria bacterium]|jgi:hypothetical protein|nr:hypothetical protein [Candidatus Margulisiibacteriota bacterium]